MRMCQARCSRCAGNPPTLTHPTGLPAALLTDPPSHSSFTWLLPADQRRAHATLLQPRNLALPRIPWAGGGQVRVCLYLPVRVCERVLMKESPATPRCRVCVEVEVVVSVPLLTPVPSPHTIWVQGRRVPLLGLPRRHHSRPGPAVRAGPAVPAQCGGEVWQHTHDAHRYDRDGEEGTAEVG